MRTLQLLSIALALSLPTVADPITPVNYNITGEVDGSGLPGVNAGDPVSGNLTTDGICQVCYFQTPGPDQGLISLNLEVEGQWFSAGSADAPYAVSFDIASDTINGLYNQFGYFDGEEGTFIVNEGGLNFEGYDSGPYPQAMFDGSITITPADVPEPSTLLLLATLSLALLLLRRRGEDCPA
jgi:hypothetical protein